MKRVVTSTSCCWACRSVHGNAAGASDVADAVMREDQAAVEKLRTPSMPM